MFAISAMSLGDSAVTALFLFITVVLVLAVLCIFFKLLSLVFSKEAQFKGAYTKFTNGIKTKVSTTFARIKKKTNKKTNTDDVNI